MQRKSWDDLRFLLAVQRAGNLSGAARRLGVDPTTVSRRLDGLQRALAVSLLHREADGKIQLTESGESVARRAEEIEHLAGLIDRGLATDNDPYAGTVRLTSIPIVVNRMLLPNVKGLVSSHPALILELFPDSRDFSLTHREADLALRLSRPRTGGTKVKARRIADLKYATYRLVGGETSAEDAVPWVTYDDGMAHLPQARWIARRLRGRPSQISPVRVRDGESALEAILSGLGKSLIPIVVGDQDPRLTRTHDEGDAMAFSRELWLLGHIDLMEREYVRAVMDWISNLFEG